MVSYYPAVSLISVSISSGRQLPAECHQRAHRRVNAQIHLHCTRSFLVHDARLTETSPSSIGTASSNTVRPRWMVLPSSASALLLPVTPSCTLTMLLFWLEIMYFPWPSLFLATTFRRLINQVPIGTIPTYLHSTAMVSGKRQLSSQNIHCS